MNLTSLCSLHAPRRWLIRGDSNTVAEKKLLLPVLSALLTTMLPSFVTLLFISGALAASALAHDEKRWRYAFLLAVGCAGWLTIWGARSLRQLLLRMDIELYAPLSILAAALPFCAVLSSLLVRRQNTPRHSPSVNDDPTLRGHVEEKIRRARKRRQDEDDLENSDQPLI